MHPPLLSFSWYSGGFSLGNRFLCKEVSPSNISYLIQYWKIRKYDVNWSIQINIDDLKQYYQSFNRGREFEWKEKLGNDLNWALSFDHLKEKDTTKHVHRLHPYKGKFIPQLVEYFLDDHIDEFKTASFFAKGNIILDPFSGSWTTLIQAHELGMHSIGIDVSHFNCLITESKITDYDLNLLIQEITHLKKIENFEAENNLDDFEKELNCKLSEFNNKFFPSPQFKREVYTKSQWRFFWKEKKLNFYPFIPR